MNHRIPGRRGVRRGLALPAVLVLALVFAGLSGTGALAAPVPSRGRGSQELLVGFLPGATPSERAEAHRRAGAEVVRTFDGIDVDLVRAAAPSTARAAFAGDPSVLFSEPNGVRTASATPADPLYDLQWGLPGIVAPGAWDVTTGSGSTIVAVVDTGVDVTHPDLAPNVWTNPGEIAGNGVDDDRNGYVDDVNGWDFAHGDASVYDPGDLCTANGEHADDHGTHAAGIVGAAGNNGVGIAGVAWHVRIMPLKFLTACGDGEDAHAVEAIMYAIRMGAKVINLSWGGPAPSESLRQALLAARDAGIVVAVAAGNGGGNLSATPDYPGSYGLPNEVVVAASNRTDALAPFSNYGGPTALAAPGVSILSTITGGGYGYKSGTSMAAPFVSGALALLRSQYPGASADELRNRLLQPVDPRDALVAPTTSSGGRLNVSASLRMTLPAVPTVTSPNGGESLLPGLPVSVGWQTNVPADAEAPGYRIEQTTNPLAAQTLSTSFDSGVPSWLAQPSNSDAPWGRAGTALRSGLVSSQNDSASWVGATVDLSVPGRVRFSWRTSSETCESAELPVCGDYFRFLVDGVEMMHASGETGWQQASYSLAPGHHVLSWAYQKDYVCPQPLGAPECTGEPSVEDAAYIDDVAIEGVDAAAWSLLGLAPSGSSSFGWTPPSAAAAVEVRVCVDLGIPCQSRSSDASDSPFTIGMVTVASTGGSTTVAERGATDTVSVALATRPTAPVVITATPDAQLAVSPSSLTFTPDDWSIPKVLTLAAVDDAVPEASPHQGTVTLSGVSDDARFSGPALGLVVASVLDDALAPAEVASATAGSPGYWLAARDGGIFAFGDAAFHGSTGSIKVAQPIVAMAPTPTAEGYWLVASDGGIFAFGDAGFYGSTGALELAQPIVGMAPTPTGRGYWLVASDGGIFAFGDARFQGSTGSIRLARPIVGMAPTPTGRGYWLVASDGGIFAFGDAAFHGSTGALELAQPIVGMASTPAGDGYWLVARDGGMFAFGSAVFHGSTGNARLNRPIVSMAPTPTGRGYWLVASDGGIFAFGDAGFHGSTGGSHLSQPIVAVAVAGGGRGGAGQAGSGG